jgi:putative endonuclease
MLEHKSGRGAKYTKGRGPFQLVYNEICEGRGAALRREFEIKTLHREQKLGLVSAKRFDG